VQALVLGWAVSWKRGLDDRVDVDGPAIGLTRSSSASLSDDRTMRTYPGVSTSPDVGYRESSLLES
jgi:hypothetical protein